MLNGISEGGGGGGALVVNITWEDDVGTFDKTAQEVINAMLNGQSIVYQSLEGDAESGEIEYYIQLYAEWGSDGCSFGLGYNNSGSFGGYAFRTDKPDPFSGYPTYSAQE